MPTELHAKLPSIDAPRILKMKGEIGDDEEDWALMDETAT
jgi:hypothetical protein